MEEKGTPVSFAETASRCKGSVEMPFAGKDSGRLAGKAVAGCGVPLLAVGLPFHTHGSLGHEECRALAQHVAGVLGSDFAVEKVRADCARLREAVLQCMSRGFDATACGL